MNKRAVSLTLDNGNLLWLQGQAQQSGARSLSELVDRLLTDARIAAGHPVVAKHRSIVGMVKILDPELFREYGDPLQPTERADRPTGRAFQLRERGPALRPSRKTPGRG